MGECGGGGDGAREWEGHVMLLMILCPSPTSVQRPKTASIRSQVVLISLCRGRTRKRIRMRELCLGEIGRHLHP